MAARLYFCCFFFLSTTSAAQRWKPCEKYGTALVCANSHLTIFEHWDAPDPDITQLALQHNRLKTFDISAALRNHPNLKFINLLNNHLTDPLDCSKSQTVTILKDCQPGETTCAEFRNQHCCCPGNIPPPPPKPVEIIATDEGSGEGSGETAKENPRPPAALRLRQRQQKHGAADVVIRVRPRIGWKLAIAIWTVGLLSSLAAVVVGLYIIILLPHGNKKRYRQQEGSDELQKLIVN